MILQESETVLQGSAKPSLLPLSNDAKFETSGILATLEHTGPNKSRRGSYFDRRVVVLLSLGVIGVLAALWLFKSAPRPTSAPVDGPKITRIAPDSAPASAAAAPIVDSAAAAVTRSDLKPESTAALITSDPINPAALAAVTASSAAVAKAQPRANSSARTSLTSSAVSDATDNDIYATHQPIALRKSSQIANAPSANALRNASKFNPANSKNSKAPTVDNDVALLAALVANDSAHALPSSNSLANAAPTKRQMTQGEREARLALNESDDAEFNVAATTARNEDIVERKPGDSSASLLQRCRQLGFLEGELCRWRICSDRWTSDAACKAQQDKAQAANGR